MNKPDRTTWHDVETETDPYELARGLEEIAKAVREFFVFYGEAPAHGWILAVRDDERRRLLLGQLAFGGAFLARISLLVDDTARQADEDRELFAQMHSEVVEEIRQRRDAGSGVRAVVARVPGPAAVGTAHGGTT